MLIGFRSAVSVIACSALAQPVFAEQAPDAPGHWQGMRPVSTAVLEQLSATGRLSAVHSPRQEIAVILWDEPKTPRPAGNKSATAGIGTLFLTVQLVDTAP